MSILETIRKQVSKDTQFLIIPADTTKEIPNLPYGTIKITSPYIRSGEGQGSEYIQDIDAKSYLVRDERYKQVLSLNIFAETEEESIEYAKTIHKWFLFFGRTFLQEQQIVVLKVGDVESRTTFLLESYEYKQGFDVRIRLSEQYRREIDSMDSVHIPSI
ncbi:phage neck terminator protein [Priestia megaterium]|uniref:phage neck terminator protein n=1 Tax=Priestia megaterium TaxID=1404 RepID=UPI000BF364E0|nr:hypothetical protein [Priestia megaterium]PFR93518.1 hypothetical protein COK39_17665 [Priestia megaterium]